MINKPLVYIIVINWNGLKDTLACLDSLMRINYSNIKIVVVDNGSIDNQIGVIKQEFSQIETIENSKNLGFASANNQGIDLALKKGAKYVLLLNNDTVVESNFLNYLIEYAEDNRDVGVLNPKILYYNSNKIWCLGGRISYLTGFSRNIGKGEDNSQWNKIIEPDFASGCAFLVRGAVFRKIGMLDPVYFAYCEDNDFCHRAKKHGYKIRVVPSSMIWHKKSSSAGVVGSNRLTAIQAYLMARNSFILAKKNFDGIKKMFFIFNQFTLKLLYNLILCRGYEARISYLRGLKDGVKFKIQTDNSEQKK